MKALLAILFFSFQKGDQPERKTGGKHLLAFFLAGLTVMFLLYGGSLLLGVAVKNQSHVYVEIRSDGDVHDIVAAIREIHRSDVMVSVRKNLIPNPVEIIFVGALGLLFRAGLILFFYKQFCRYMTITPTV